MSSDSRIAAALLFSALVVSATPAAAQKPEAATLTNLNHDVACAPSSPSVKPTGALTVAAGREARKTLFGVGDALVIRGGTAQGVKTGDEYYVRRVIDDRFNEQQPGVYRMSVHTAGAVQILEAQDDASIATVTYACDGVMEGDFLERFERPSIPAAEVGTRPDYARRPGRPGMRGNGGTENLALAPVEQCLEVGQSALLQQGVEDAPIGAVPRDQDHS